MVDINNTVRPGANKSGRLTPEERQRLIAKAENLHQRRQKSQTNSARVQAVTSQRPKRVDPVRPTKEDIIKEKQKLEHTEVKRVAKQRSAEEQRKFDALRAKYGDQAKHKVVKAKQSRYVKSNKPVNNYTGLRKKQIRNLKISRATGVVLTLALLGFGGYKLYDSGLIQDMYSDYKLNQAMEAAQQASSNYMTNLPGVEIPEFDEAEDIEETFEEDVVEEKHETINTDLYDEGYEFNPDITPEMLTNLNPILSRNTAYLEIPGTRISYAFVSPSTANIDEVPGLRQEIDNSGETPQSFMNCYFLHRDITLNKSSKGTLFLDLYNRPLICKHEDLSDMNIIYGHHMSDKSMFNGLMNWKTDSNGTYNAEHPFGIIYTDDGYGYKLTFIASQVISGTDVDALHPYNFESYEEKCEYIQNMIDRAHENGWFALDSYEVQEDDKFMSLVTCTYEYDNARFQLIGVLQRIKVRDTMYCNDHGGYFVEENSATLNR